MSFPWSNWFIFTNCFMFLKELPPILLKKYPSKRLKTTKDHSLATSYYLSLVHSTISLLISYYYYPSSETLNLPNTLINNRIISFSLSYFTVDLGYSIYLRNFDYVTHHCCAILPLLSSLYLGNSGNLLTVALFFGEFTNPIQNLAWLLRCHGLPFSQPLFLIYNITYITFRLFVSPVILYYLWNKLDHGLVSYIFLVNYLLIYLVTCYWTKTLVKKSVKIINNYRETSLKFKNEI